MFLSFVGLIVVEAHLGLSEFRCLCVGCGSAPLGDVNCDLFIVDVGHRSRSGGYGKRLAVNRIRNFVLCDANFLPFGDGVFEEVACFHVIEHLERPYYFLGELLRVSNHTVKVRCPHRLGDRLRGRYVAHVGFFNRSWFVRAAEGLGVCCDAKVSRFIFGFVPLELEVYLWKN